MFGGAYGNARMPNWLHWHRTPCPGLPQWACIETKGERFRVATFLPPFLLCYSKVRTVRLHSPFILGSIRISGLDGKLTAGCLRSGPAWIVFCFHYWVTDGKNGGMARSGIGCWWLWAAPAAPALSPSWGTLSEPQKRPPGPILLCFSA